MKKSLLIIMLLFGMIFLVAACDSSTTKKEEDAKDKVSDKVSSDNTENKESEVDNKDDQKEDKKKDEPKKEENTQKNNIKKLVCTSDDYYNNGDKVIYKGEFTFENGSVTRYEYKLTVPSKYDPNDYYVQEQVGNMGRYEMSLDGRVISNVLTPSWSYWKDWPHKNKTIEQIKKIFEDILMTCEIVE